MFKENPDYKDLRTVKIPKVLGDRFNYRNTHDTLPAPANTNQKEETA